MENRKASRIVTFPQKGTRNKFEQKKISFMITYDNENRLRTLNHKQGDISRIMNIALKEYLDKVGAKW